MTTLQDYVHHIAYNAGQIMEPKSLGEALTSEHGKQWKAATDSEYESLSKEVNSVTYQLIVGSLLYATIATRPDIRILHSGNSFKVLFQTHRSSFDSSKEDVALP